MERITIRKVKLNGIVLTWSAYVLEQDADGFWLFTPTGSAVDNRRGEEQWTGNMGTGVEPGFLWRMPTNGEWWFGAWWTRPDRHQISIDACTPPTLLDGVWTWTDLELDICRNDLDGSVWTEDEDEFDDSLQAGLIDEHQQREALAVTAEMERRLRERIAPFDDSGWPRYAAAGAQNLAAF